MSKAITIKHGVKRYGDNTVIPDMNMTIRNGEFFTLLGPSGCGKTTLLRMIAGFNTIEGGEFYFDDTLINELDPGIRNIGMVFQNYAIFPNMSVRKNVQFGLKNRKVKLSAEKIKEETDKFLKLVHVEQYADRLPDKLSGGQQQRVALARALVIRPDVLLMDEPLSNLDAKLRVEMRTAIRSIQKDVGITTVYVTHDQEEAMSISDRIAVMKAGVIRQCSKPKNIYMRPADIFVATFIGKTNILEGQLKMKGNIPELSFKDGYTIPVESVDPQLMVADVRVSCRPEELTVIVDQNEPGMKATINDSIFLGLETHYFVLLDTGERAEIVQVSDIEQIIPPGTRVRLSVNTSKVNIFNAETGKSIMKNVDWMDMGTNDDDKK